MSTILFNQIVFGPVKSRRLGISLGINLLPLRGKLCNFDCIYCECGYNKDGMDDKKLPATEDVIYALKEKLLNNDTLAGEIDSITFSGNGEPTLHPSFGTIVNKTIELRDLYAPKAKVSVLTNGTGLSKREIAESLLKVDNAIIKIDSPFSECTEAINQPNFSYSPADIVTQLKQFEGRFILQTMFLRGRHNGIEIDNTRPEQIEAWYKIVEQTKPKEVMIYTIDRDTPEKDLEKVSTEQMEAIATPLREAGFKVTVSG